MTLYASSDAHAAPTAPAVVTLQHGLLWLMGLGGAIVFIEPSPYEIFALTSVVVFAATGLRMRLAFLPLALLLFAVNLGYTICAVPLLDEQPIVYWILTSWYMAVTALFIALAVSEDTAARLHYLRSGLIAGAVIASLAGIAGYLRLTPGELFTLYGRAAGTFKDPNVFGAYLVLPALFCLQSVVSDTFGRSLRSSILLGIITLALLLAFSRAAWGLLALTGAFMLLLMMLTSQTNRQRSRIVVMAIAALIAVALVLVILLQFDFIRDMFEQRASFDQKYDEGRFGRFGRHMLGAQMALDLPLGIGPLQFNKFFPEDTHNSYLNAFMSGGWISGVVYPALVFTTALIGFRYIFARTPWQRPYLAVFSAYLGTVGEAFIIDTDHWRHFWLMLGLMWGMFVATQRHIANTRHATERDVAHLQGLPAR
ncbi:MAG: O-antigen ligase domain-containing protein [Bradyrhizobiaceae bacterium]|nr:MAG: O-antigen ligase domain-containing protein [Bradyrhizobiaceae bacterium]